MRHIITFLFLLIIGNSFAQWNWPVQVYTNTVPPYYNYLSSYADQNDHLQIMVTLADQNATSVTAKLHIRIEGEGWWIETKPFNNISPISLEPFVPNIISGIQLQPYFQQVNLIKSSPQLDLQNLPEGYTNICVEVIGVGGTLTVIAGNQCTPFFLQLFQPPQQTFPACESTIDTTSMFHLFQWTPAPIASSELNYTFSLYEWVDPNNFSIFQTGQGLVYQETTNSTSLQISNFDVQLQNGMNYVWRVKAQLTDNGMPVQMFENNGLSEICTFQYGESTSLDEQLAEGLFIDLDAEASTQYKGFTHWTVVDNTPGQGLSTYNSFFLEYRLKPDTEHPNPNWQRDTVFALNKFIYQLGPERTYQVKVSGIVGNYVSSPSELVEFTTPAAINYACGDQQQPYVPQNYTPNEFITAGKEVQIGQFMMSITEAIPQGSIGHYSGKGTIPIQFLNGARAKVQFSDILIDNEFVVRQGRVDVITDGVDNWLHEQYMAFIEPIYIDGTIDSAWVDTIAGVAWVIVDGVSIPFNFDPPDYDIIFNDDSGYQWTISPNGTIVVSGYLNPSSDYLNVTAENAAHFQQSNNEVFGFDAKEHMQWHEQYEVIELIDSSYYFVPNKSIGKDETDVVDILIASGVTATFKLDDQINISASQSGNLYTLQIPSISNGGEHTIYAYDGTSRIGKLNLYVFSPKERDVVIVPLSQFSIPKAQVENIIASTLGEANIQFNVTIAEEWSNENFSSNTSIQLPTDPGLLNKYSSQMTDLRDEYFYENDLKKTDAFYLFIVSGFSDPNETGYMPRGKSLGFIKATQSDVLTTIAHELAHGAGAMEHSWKNNGPSQYSTDNLMDYENTSNPVRLNLTMAQWAELRDVDYLPNIWDDEQDGSNANVFYAEGQGSNSTPAPVVGWLGVNESTLDIFKISEETYVRFSEQAKANISSYGFENGQLKYLDLVGGHTAILGRTGYRVEEVSYSDLLLANAKTDGQYSFLCTDSLHNLTDRTMGDAVYHGESISVILKKCSHDFTYGIQIQDVECHTISGDVIAGYDHSSGQHISEAVHCPPPINSDNFYIPVEWRNKSDNTVSFMTPDGKTIKMKPAGIKGLDFSLGLNKAETPMMPAGCLTSISKKDLETNEITTYKAEYLNGQFTGYKSEDGTKYFTGALSRSSHVDTGIILLPVVSGLGAFRYDAYNSQYEYYGETTPAGSILSLENDIHSIKGWEMSLISTYDYSPDDVANGVINPLFTEELLDGTMTQRNSQLRLVSKILELRTQYPELYKRMSACDFGEWGCISWSSVAAMAVGLPTENIMSAALGDNLGWGYFDYCFDNNGYASLNRAGKFEQFLIHFNELIAYNRSLQESTINEFLDEEFCEVILDGGPVISTHPNWEPETIFNALNSMSVDEIEEICLQTRSNLIACLSFKPYGVTNDYEKCIYRLIHHVKPGDEWDLVNMLCNQEYNNVVLIKKLAEKLDDKVFLFGDDDYFTLVMNRLIEYYVDNTTPINFNNLSESQVIEWRSRMVSYNYVGFVNRLINTCTPVGGSPVSSISAVDIQKVGGNWRVTYQDELQLCFMSVGSTNNRSFAILEPLIVSDKANLIDLIHENGNAITLPAFVLYFIEEKAIAQTAVQAIETGVDVATLFIPGAQGKILFRVLGYADKLSAVANMGANYTSIDNPTLSKYLSLTSGILGLVDMSSPVAINAFKGLRTNNNASTLLSIISRDADKLNKSYVVHMQEFLAKVNTGTDADLVVVINNAQTRAVLIETLEKEKEYLVKLGKQNIADQVGIVINNLENVVTGLANSLTGALKASYDKLILEGLNAVEQGNIIKLFNAENKLVAEIANNKLVFKYSKYGGDIAMVEGKTTTVFGRFDDQIHGGGTKVFIQNSSKLYETGANPNGLNILNIDDWTWAKNEAWLIESANRGDIMRFISDPTNPTNIFKNGIGGEKTVTGLEIQTLESLGFVWNPSKFEFIRP